MLSDGVQVSAYPICECSNTGHHESWILSALRTEPRVVDYAVTQPCLACGREVTASCSTNASLQGNTARDAEALKRFCTVSV